MLTLSFRFVAGRYHATPWGRHVNEADVAWPPEPWRLLRTLIATWHRKADQDQFPASALAALINRLAEDLPVYSLPPAVHAHSRHYMPKRGLNETTLVFDGFARVNAEIPLRVRWRTVSLSGEDRAVLDHLLPRIGYLGRAESWVEAALEPETGGEEAPFDCCPVSDTDGEVKDGMEPIPLLAPLTASAWAEARPALVAAAPAAKGAKAKRLAVLGEQLVDLLSTDSADWQREGFARPPGTRAVIYVRPAESLSTRPKLRQRPAAHAEAPPPFTTARFLISGKPRPLLTDAVKVGELMRSALMSQAKSLLGEENIPWQLSGHDLPQNTHDHAFFLPEDSDKDGHIDHITVYAKGGFPEKDLHRAFARVNTLWVKGEIEWPVILEAVGTLATMAPRSKAASPIATAKTWRSCTPYLHPWYRKPGFGREEQLRKELALRGFPEPETITPLETIPVHGKTLRPVHFHRFRRKRGKVDQPDSQGSFWCLTFPEAVTGPLALGYGAHFGLGLFIPGTGEPADAAQPHTDKG